MIRPDKIVRSDRKTLSVSVDSFGKVTVRAPKKYSDERIAAFLAEKESWIVKHKRRKEGASEKLPSDDLQGFRFTILGEDTEIFLYEGSRIVYQKQDGALFLPKENARERLVKWLKENAKRIFLKACEERAKETGLRFSGLTVTSAKTRWGSCSFDNTLHFTFRLLYAPKEIVDYVVVHELAHTVHKNHGAAFWKLVGKWKPNYPTCRAWLKNHGYLLYIF